LLAWRRHSPTAPPTTVPNAHPPCSRPTSSHTILQCFTPSAAALALAAEIAGPAGADPVIDLDIYRQITEAGEQAR